MDKMRRKTLRPIPISTSKEYDAASHPWMPPSPTLEDAKNKKKRHTKSVLMSPSFDVDRYAPVVTAPVPMPLNMVMGTKREGPPREIRDFYLTVLNDLFRSMGMQENHIKDVVIHFETGMINSEEKDYPFMRKKSRKILSDMMQKVNVFLQKQTAIDKIVLVQSLVRGWLVRKKFLFGKSSFSSLNRRNEVYANLVKNEQTYLKNMTTLVNSFLLPLRKYSAKRTKITKEEIDGLFCNLENLVHLHEVMLKRVQGLKEKWPFTVGLGGVFLDIARTLSVYGDYAENYQHCRRLIRSFQEKKPKVWHFIEELQKEAQLEEGQSFETLLQQPVDRIKFYETTFEQLTLMQSLNTTDQDEIISAYSIMQQLSDLVKKRLDRAYARARVNNIQIRLISPTPLNIMVEGRDLYTEGILGDGKQKKDKFHLFLFNDMLLITKAQTNEKCKLLEMVDLAMLNVNWCDSKKDSFEVATPRDKYMFLDRPETCATWHQDISELSRKKKNKVFGVDLAEVLEAEKRDNGIPIVVEVLVTWLRDHKALSTEGLLRISGSHAKTASLKAYLDRAIKPEQIKDIITDSMVETPHDVAAVLKTYFKELPDPLLTFDLYPQFLATQKNDNISVEDQVKMTRHLIIEKLPKRNFELLKYLIDFLADIETFSQVNLMTLQNLAIVMTPNVLRPREQTIDTACDGPYLLGVIQLIVEYRHLIFAMSDVDESKLVIAKPSKLHRMSSHFFSRDTITTCS